MTTLSLKFSGRVAELDVPNGVAEIPVPWPSAHEPEHILTVRVLRDADGRPLRLKVQAIDSNPKWVQGDGGTAYRGAGKWWKVSGKQERAVR